MVCSNWFFVIVLGSDFMHLLLWCTVVSFQITWRIINSLKDQAQVMFPVEVLNRLWNWTSRLWIPGFTAFMQIRMYVLVVLYIFGYQNLFFMYLVTKLGLMQRNSVLFAYANNHEFSSIFIKECLLPCLISQFRYSSSKGIAHLKI